MPCFPRAASLVGTPCPCRPCVLSGPSPQLRSSSSTRDCTWRIGCWSYFDTPFGHAVHCSCHKRSSFLDDICRHHIIRIHAPNTGPEVNLASVPRRAFFLYFRDPRKLPSLGFVALWYFPSLHARGRTPRYTHHRSQFECHTTLPWNAVHKVLAIYVKVSLLLLNFSVVREQSLFSQSMIQFPTLLFHIIHQRIFSDWCHYLHRRTPTSLISSQLSNGLHDLCSIV